jgi:hypothetical protein
MRPASAGCNGDQTPLEHLVFNEGVVAGRHRAQGRKARRGSKPTRSAISPLILSAHELIKLADVPRGTLPQFKKTLTIGKGGCTFTLNRAHPASGIN